MGNTKLVHGSLGIIYGFALTGSIGFLGAKGGISLARAVESVRPDMPVEILPLAMAPLASYFAHKELMDRANASRTALPHIRNKLSVGSAVAVAMVGYLTIFDDGLVFFERKSRETQVTYPITEPVMPFPQ